jgi:hypothetical protein
MTKTNYRVDSNGDVWRVCNKCGKEKHQSELRPSYNISLNVSFRPLCLECDRGRNRRKRDGHKKEHRDRRYKKLVGTGKELMADEPEYKPSHYSGRKGGNSDICSVCPKLKYCRDRVSGKVSKRWPMCVRPDKNDLLWQEKWLDEKRT